MISFWFHIKQPGKFHRAVAAQSGKPIMRVEGRVIKRQTGGVITRQGGRHDCWTVCGAKSTFVLLAFASMAVAHLTRDEGGLLPSRSPGWPEEATAPSPATHLHDHDCASNSLTSCYVVILIWYSLSPDISVWASTECRWCLHKAGVSQRWEPLARLLRTSLQ